MIHIPLKNHPPSDAWIKKADRITKLLLSASSRNEAHTIIDKHSAVWSEIKEHLLSLSHGKCWYSEAKDKFSHYHVDHFRPKKRALDCDGKDCGGYYWLAFDWKNYRICGSVGNTKKGDRFHVRSEKASTVNDPLDDEVYYFLDPINKHDPRHLAFDETGIIKPIESDSTTWSYKRAAYTIENLDLNYEPLKEYRRTLWQDITMRINEILNLTVELNLTPSASIQSKIDAKIDQLSQYIAPEHEFSATARACLKKSGYD